MPRRRDPCRPRPIEVKLIHHQISSALTGLLVNASHCSEINRANSPRKVEMTIVPENATREDEPRVHAVRLDRNKLLGFRALPSLSADAVASDAVEELKLLHNKIGFGELPPPP
jgi:hypothetical protein